MTIEVIKHVEVQGRVQGVGYRAWTADEARSRGLRGWVRNRSDGSVEAIFAGDATVVEAMISACRHGPSMARVTNVVAREATADEVSLRGSEAFVVLPTI